MSHGHAPLVILPVTLDRKKVTVAKCLDRRGYPAALVAAKKTHVATAAFGRPSRAKPAPRRHNCQSRALPEPPESVIKPRDAGNAAPDPPKPPTPPRHRPLEPHRARGEFHHRQRHIRAPLHRRRHSRKIQPDGRA